MSEAELVIRELRDRVAIISFNRPEKHNAIDDAMADQWFAALDWAMEDRAVRVIVLRGEGKSFSSGRDTTALGTRAGGDSDYLFVRRGQDHGLRLAECPKPVIVAMKGYLIGGSFEMALRADYRVASDDISVAVPEINFGILPDTGGTQLLTILAGPSRAKYLVMMGERIGAERALEWGIVDEVVRPEELDARVMEIATKLANQPPQAVAMAKHLVDHVWSDVVRRGTREELLAITALFSSHDYTEARAARAEGRPPLYDDL